MQPAKLSGLLARLTPALALLAVAWPLVGCGDDASESASAPTDPPMLQQQSEDKPEDEAVDLEDLGGTSEQTPDTESTETEVEPADPVVLMDPYRVLEEKIAELPNIVLAEVYFDLGADALERAEDTDDYTGDRLVVWLVVENSTLQIPDPDGPGVIDALHAIPDATKDSIMQLVTEAFPDADSVEIFVDQESSSALAEDADTTLGVTETPIEETVETGGTGEIVAP